MRRRFFMVLGVFLGLVLALSLPPAASAQEKVKAAKGEMKEDRLTGTVHMINKDTRTITLRRGNVQRQVVWNDATKFTYRNQPSTIDEVKDGRRLICLGKFDEKTRLVATRVDVREGK